MARARYIPLYLREKTWKEEECEAEIEGSFGGQHKGGKVCTWVAADVSAAQSEFDCECITQRA